MIALIKKLGDILPPSDKWKLVVLFFMMLVAAGLEVIGISMILGFVSVVIDPDRLTQIEWLSPILAFLGIETQRDFLVYGSLGLIGVFMIKNAYIIVFHYLQAVFAYNRFQKISKRLFGAYMQAPYTFHLNQNTALLVRNVTNETRILVKGVLLPMLLLVREFVIALVVIVFLLAVEPLITTIIFILLGGSGLIFLKLLKKKTKNYGARSLKYRGRMIQEVNEGLGGFKDVSVLNRKSWFVNRFNYSVNKFARAAIFKEVARNSAKPVIETMVVSGLLLISLVLVMQGRGIESIVPILTLFSISAIRLMPAMEKIVSEYSSLRYYGYALYPVHADLMELSRKKECSQQNDGQKKIAFKKEIAFHNVGYCYPNTSKPAVRDIEISIRKGTTVGFVGSSGAGKTTLADILLGLLKPTKGSISVDGQDVWKNLLGWQKNIGYIPQSIYLSDDTIRNNIAFGLNGDDIDEKQVMRAVKISQLEHFIDELPQGLDTVVGERGVRISGGQRQRIGIARALYHNPQVLIMDEATSALDNETERYITKAIDQLRGQLTIIIIAHRLSTVRECDVLHCMRNGSIVDSGTFDNLLKESKCFKAMASSLKE